jgi:hypothetical protein
MSFAIFYNTDDSTIIQNSYLASRGALSANDRQNIDAVWNAGLSAWNTTATHALVNGVWNAACFRNGVLDNGLCDEDTRIIVINGVWARSVAVYGATAGQPITKAGFVGLMRRLSAADADAVRGAYINALASDIADTGREPYP